MNIPGSIQYENKENPRQERNKGNLTTITRVAFTG